MEVPRDGARSWLFLLAAAFGQAVQYGTNVAGGLLNAYMIDTFNESRGYTSVPFAVSTGILMMGGILVTPVVNKLGCRLGLCLAGLLASSGLIISSFATSIGFLILSFGLLAGMGMSFGFLSANVAVGECFLKHRLLAFALMSTGNAVGLLIFPPLVHLFTEIYSWRGSLLIMAAFCLHPVVAALLLPRDKPPGTDRQRVTSNNTAPTLDKYTDGSVVEMDLISSTKEMKQRNGIYIKPKEVSEQLQVNAIDTVEKTPLQSSIETPTDHGPKSSTKYYYWDIFRNRLYLITMISAISRGFGKNIYNIHLVAIGLHTVLQMKEAPNVLLIMGCIHVVIRPLAGILVSFSSRMNMLVWGLSAALVGILSLFGPLFTHSRTSFYAFVTCFCILDSTYESLYSAVHFEAVGAKRFSTAFGTTGLLYGVAQLLSPPIAGVLFDKYKKYDSSFYLAGVSFLAGGTLACFGWSLGLSRCRSICIKRSIKN